MKYSISVKQEVYKMKVDGLSYKEISFQTRIPYNTLTSWFRSKNLSQEQRSKLKHPGIKYSYNMKLFETPNALTYYLLGVFYADGNVHQNLKTIILTSKDLDWLEAINKVVCPTSNIIFHPKNCSYSYLRINNKIIVDWFVKSGCVPAKSLIVNYPTNMPAKYNSHFIRGVFDGDGCMAMSKPKKGTYVVNFKPTIVTASEKFFDILTKVLNANNIKVSYHKSKEKDHYSTMYIIHMCGGANAVRFCEFIYKDNNICLQRKYDKYQEYLNIRKEEILNIQKRRKSKS